MEKFESKIISEIRDRINKSSKETNRKIRIVLPEYNDKRILEAACYVKDDIDIVIVGNIEETKRIIKENNIKLDIEDITYIDIENVEKTEKEKYADLLYEKRKHKGMTQEEANSLIENEVYYSFMMLENSDVDGLVSGATHSTSETLKPALQIIGKKEGCNLVSAFFLMEMKDEMKEKLSLEDVYVFSDCGLIENPNALELVEIAKQSASSYNMITKKEAKVAMLSYSTKGSAHSILTEKVVDATNILKEENNLNVDGELQLDAAIIPEIGKKKAPESKVAGYANTLIFPDLNAGNIGYKLVQRFAGANAYGPLCQGLKKPVNDLSRGSNVEDIIGVIYITALQATSK